MVSPTQNAPKRTEARRRLRALPHESIPWRTLLAVLALAGAGLWLSLQHHGLAGPARFREAASSGAVTARAGIGGDPHRPRPVLRVNGILTGRGGKGQVLVNGEMLSVGDTVEGARVVDITPHSVTFEFAGERFTLGM